MYYPTYYIKIYTVVLNVYSGLPIHPTWPINYRLHLVSDVTHMNAMLKYRALDLTCLLTNCTDVDADVCTDLTCLLTNCTAVDADVFTDVNGKLPGIK